MTDAFEALRAAAASAPEIEVDTTRALAGSTGALPEPSRRPEFFAAVRKRGLLNAMLSMPEDEFKRRNPGWGVRWEYAPPNGDTTLVTAREAIGYRLVDSSEIGGKPGPIRRGDTVMMAAPLDIIREIEAQDARAAADDLHSPESAYYDALRANKVVTKGGETAIAEPTGHIRSVEEVRPAFMDRTGNITPAPQ